MGESPHPVSVMILTKDEEVNIGRCLDHLGFSDDIIVYDSFSTDRTCEIARTRANVRVVQRKFDDWSSHQNWGVANLPFKHPWVLYVDADEHVDAELAREIGVAADPGSSASAYRVRRKDYLMGRWLKHAQLYPTWFVRLFRPSKIRWERLVNPVAVVEGETRELSGHLVHYPFSKGMSQWFERHNSYSSFEARELMKVLGGTREPWRHVLSGDPNVRRRALKDVFFRMPCRPQVKWLYYVVWRRAFLDGRAGLTYARLQYLYEYMIAMKWRELRSRGEGGAGF